MNALGATHLHSTTPLRPLQRALPAQVSAPAELVSAPDSGVSCKLHDGRSLQLPGPGGRLSLGRDPQSNVVFRENDVSRKHAEIVEKDGIHWLRDVGSSNGTFLNGEQLETGKWAPFRPGDQLRFGSDAGMAQETPDLLPRLHLPARGAAVQVGRDAGSSLKLAWPETSRFHAVIQEHNGHHFVFDQGSSNGTFVDGQRIPSKQWVVVGSGQQVQFGAAEAAFRLAPRENGATGQTAPAPAARPAPRPSSCTPLDAASSASLLQRAQFLDNPLGIRALGAPDCTQSFLHSRGLQPKHTVEVDGTRMHVSEPYSMGQNRVGFVAYVEDPQGKVQVRAFYRSNSQGLWRSASHAGMNGWIGKGNGEASTNLPVAAQKHLHALAAGGGRELAGDDSNTAFYGLLPFGGHEPPAALDAQLQAEQPLGQFSQPLPSRDYGRPETFRYNSPADAPAFNKQIDGYSFQHPIHGKVEAHCFESANGNYHYMFYQDSEQRSWLAQIDRAGGELTDWGTRAAPVFHGDLAMPAVEYPSQIPEGYAGKAGRGGYVDASAYVHRLPPVADFRRHRGLA